MANKCKVSHEVYIRKVADLGIARLSPDEATKARAIKLVYGAGPDGVRGVTYYGKWKAGEEVRPFVEICAFSQENWIQVAGTTLHELAHVLAPVGTGHGPNWHAACERLGLRRMAAAGTEYKSENFARDLWRKLEKLAKPDDGEPVPNMAMASGLGLLGNILGSAMPRLKGCQAGIGTRGGHSRGTGSGSRLRLYQCQCERPHKIRCASDTLDATCNASGTPFTQPNA